MTGEEFKNAHHVFSAAIGRRLSQADIAKIIGLSDPAGNGKDTIRKWEMEGPSGPVGTLIQLAIDGLTRRNREVEGFIIQWILEGVDP